MFDFYVHTRAHFGLRAKKKIQIRKFLSLCHAHNSQLFFTTDEEAAASKCKVFYVFSAQKSILTSFFIFNSTTCLGPGTDKNEQGLQICHCFLLETYHT